MSRLIKPACFIGMLLCLGLTLGMIGMPITDIFAIVGLTALFTVMLILMQYVMEY